MNSRTEEKLKDLSGMSKAVNELLQQAWERGYKYGLHEGYVNGVRDSEAKLVRINEKTINWLLTPNGYLYCSHCKWTSSSREHFRFCPNCGFVSEEVEDDG